MRGRTLIRKDIKFGFRLSGTTVILSILTLLLLFFYIQGVATFFKYGHEAYNVSRVHPWGFLVAAYEFFVALAMGCGIVGASAIFFDIEILKPIVKRVLIFGLLSLFAGFSAFLFEIGHPIRMVIYTALSGNPSSALFWLGVFYPLFMVFTFLTFVAYAKGSSLAKLFAALTLTFSIASILTAGSIFGNLNTRLFASGVFYQIEFIMSATLGAIFIVNIYSVLFGGEGYKKAAVFLKKLSIAIISLLIIAYIVKYISGVYGAVPQKADTIKYIFSSDNFLIYEVGLGLILPLIVAIFGSKDRVGFYFLASIFGLAGIMYARVNLVEGLQLAPMQPLQTKMYQESVLLLTSYSPSVTELSIGLGAIGVYLLFLYLGEKILNLE